jgi:prepilin-type N-terminal cleavage/methylation domain-containing protein
MLRRGFTLLELLVVTVIITALIAILLPSLGKARVTSKRVACGTALHNLAIGIRAYLSDFNEIYPTSAQMPSVNTANEALPVTLRSYITVPRAWRCPADAGSYVRASDNQGFDSYFAGETLSFDYNMGLGGRRIQNTFLYSMLRDSGTYVLQDFDNFHDKKIPLCKNILFADTHVGTIDDVLKAIGSPATQPH